MAQAQQVADRPKSSAGGKVTVACKHPAGIVIRGFTMVERSELVMGGGSRLVREAAPTGDSIIINGNARKLGEEPRCQIVAGYALTEGVDQDIWEAWLKDNERSALVVNRLIFGHENRARVVDWCKDQGSTRSGLEPLAKDGDPRTPKAPGLRIAPADEQASRSAA